MRRPDSDRASSQRSTPRAGRGTQGIGERYIAGVPARIMRPRLVFLTCLFSLVCFGLLMVYSASSVEALHEPSTTKICKKWNTVVEHRRFPHDSTAGNAVISARRALPL